MQRLSGFFVAVMQRYLPDPWLFAIVLTFVVFLMGIGLTDSSALDMVGFWGEGLFGLLEFSMQMVLILVTGYVLARTRVVRSGLEAVARRAGGPASAIVITTVFATVASFILIEIIASWFNAIATPETLPFWAFISGGIVNFFAPSGGGQWAIQGPVMVEAAQQIGADLGQVAMGVAWGDAWTNMVQPFWLLPALGIAGLKARDVMGYCVMALLVSGVIITAGLLLLT